MGQHNKKTLTLLTTIERYQSGEVNTAGLEDLFTGEMVADVFAKVPRHARQLQSHGDKRDLMAVHELVTVANGFDANFSDWVAKAYLNQRGRQSNQPQAKPGKSDAQAKKVLLGAARKGLLTTAAQLPSRGDRGRQLVSAVSAAAAARTGGRRRA